MFFIFLHFFVLNLTVFFALICIFLNKFPYLFGSKFHLLADFFFLSFPLQLGFNGFFNTLFPFNYKIHKKMCKKMQKNEEHCIPP